MFKELYAIARHTALSIMVTPAGEKLSLIIIPKPHGTEEKALGQPIQVSGTPEELDRELCAELERYCAAHNELRSNLGESIEAIQAKAAKKKPAEKKAEPKPARAAKKKARPTPPRPAKRAAKKATPRPAPKPQQSAAPAKAESKASDEAVLNLFGAD